MPAQRCNVCGSADPRPYHDQGYRRLVRCRSCRLVFADPLPSPDDKAETERLAYESDLLPEVAEFFRNCHRDFEEDAVIRGFRHALRWIGQARRAGRMLDVGPGTGIFLHLASNEFGWQPYGIDICQESAEKARTEFDVTVEVGDFLAHPYEPASFDAITMLDVLEHTLDPAAVLARAWELLAPGGVLYVAVPNQRCLMTIVLDRYIQLGGPGRKFFLDRLYVPPHVYYFNPRALALALANAGFEIVGVTGGNVYLGRYRLAWWMRVPMEIVLQAGSLVGMSAKILALARKPEAVT
jgi:2-polyprenyl-3-methyl-5-hydroxy-6-metoxy-1,4-benzoquinol methylase